MTDPTAAQGTNTKAANGTSRGLTKDELAHALAGYPPLLTVHEAARLIRVSSSCIHHRIARGELRGIATRGRKPTLIFRDRLVRAYFRDAW